MSMGKSSIFWGRGVFIMDFVIRTDFPILVVFLTMFRPSDPPAFFRCISNSGTVGLEFRTQPFIATGVPCSHSIKAIAAAATA